MTDTVLAARRPGLFARLFVRLRNWLAEEVYVDGAPREFSRRDWADLPIHHPIRDDRGGR